MDEDYSFIDVIILIILIGLVFLVAWILKMVYKLDQTKIEKFCKNGITVPLKAKSIIDKTKSGLTGAVTGDVPPNDVSINFKLKC
jgi:hypothetical protein